MWQIALSCTHWLRNMPRWPNAGAGPHVLSIQLVCDVTEVMSVRIVSVIPVPYDNLAATSSWHSCVWESRPFKMIFFSNVDMLQNLDLICIVPTVRLNTYYLYDIIHHVLNWTVGPNQIDLKFEDVSRDGMTFIVAAPDYDFGGSLRDSWRALIGFGMIVVIMDLDCDMSASPTHSDLQILSVNRFHSCGDSCGPPLPSTSAQLMLCTNPWVPT